MTAPKTVFSRATLIIVLGLTGAFWLATNLPWRLDDYDQAQQAFTSWEMIHEGHWFYQRTPHELIAQKPPLVGWVSAGLFSLTRSWELAWTLPSLVSACALAASIFYAARSEYGASAAFVALCAFCLNLLTVRLATLVRTDMPLALVTFLPGWMIFDKVRKSERWQTRDRVVFTALLSLSMWIKGPFVYVFLLPPVLIARWVRRRHPLVAAWSGWWPWLVSLAVFAPWVIGGLCLFPTFYQQVIGFEVVDRLALTPHRAFGPYLPAAHRAFGPYFYVAHLLHKWAPWSILMLGLCAAEIRRSRRSIRRALAPATSWLLLWSCTGLAIMSLVPSKRVDRVYSAVPPLCLLLAAQVAAVSSDAEHRRKWARWFVVALAFAIVFTGGYTIWKVGLGYRDHLDALRRFGNNVRAEAIAHRWRYEVISGLSGSEGMLLYLDRPRFIEVEDAVRQWNAGQLDALAVPKNVEAELLPQLSPAGTTVSTSTHRRTEPRVDYKLIVRSNGS